MNILIYIVFRITLRSVVSAAFSEVILIWIWSVDTIRDIIRTWNSISVISSQHPKAMGVGYSRIEYEEFHINLLEYSVYSYCYIFSIKVYMIKLRYRAYTMQLEGNSNLVKL